MTNDKRNALESHGFRMGDATEFLDTSTHKEAPMPTGDPYPCWQPPTTTIHIPSPAPELADIARHLGRIADALEVLTAREQLRESSP